MKMDLSSEIYAYIRGGYSILYIVTPEESRAELLIAQAVSRYNKEGGKDNARKLYTWSVTEGFKQPGNSKMGEQIEDPIDALIRIKDDVTPAVWIMRDLHSVWSGTQSYKILRMLRDFARDFKQTNRTLIITSPVNKLPQDIERDVVLIEFDLPNREEIIKVWEAMYTKDLKNKLPLDVDEQEAVIQSCSGLTMSEAENAMAKGLVLHSISKKETPDNIIQVSQAVLNEKAIAVKKSGVLEYFKPEEMRETINDIGGLENLKSFMLKRKLVFSKKAREFGLPLPRGIALVGLPGCGKSLSAKAAANIMGIPLLRLDVGRIFGSLVGQSESNLRNAIQTIEAIGSCVVWVDEMDKAFAGMGGGEGGGSTDSGVSQRVFGNFITWMQEKRSCSLIVATFNRTRGLPPELLRKGRFDEIFFVGLPSDEEQKQILAIHLKKFKRDPRKFDLERITKSTSNFSGAELEQIIKDAMFEAFAKDTDINTEFLERAAQNTVPLFKSRGEDLTAMAKWASENAVPASIPTSERVGITYKRQISI